MKPKSKDLILSSVIKGSRVSIVVFTTDFACTTWSLKELEKIMEYRSSRGQQVVPVFYEVDPKEVFNQSGHFGEALLATLARTSTNQAKVVSYMTALKEAAAISPRFLTNFRDRSKTIDSIVGHVTSLLDSTALFVAEHPVGINSHVQDLIQLLDNKKSDSVFIMAIWGMGGIGKTTVAKILYNQISHNFDVRKFVPDIDERMEDFPRRWPLGIIEEELLLFLKEQVATKACNFDSTSVIWWEGIRCVKVLLVLDNVRSEKELEVLPVTCECFGPGSIIIITTRTKHDLFNEIGINHVYRLKEMDYNECVELFSQSAFKKATPERTYADLINRALEYSDGLPLALVAVGSVLFERSRVEWESVLERLKRFPLQDVWQVLRKSIDSLGYDMKQMFLVLAYLSHFFIGMDRNDVTQILQKAGCDVVVALNAIKGLEDHSLVSFEKDKFRMHRLIQDIGREMYLKESSIKPQQRPYDVFLSFRGKDTRSNFMSHLHASLENASIYVFKDDDEEARGENISLSLLKAIGESRISIIILSPNYADSKWCLQELEDIMRCYNNQTQKVLPVFHHVDPSEVRNQAGRFGEAFEEFIKKNPQNKVKEQDWRKALRDVGSTAGFVVQNWRNESEDIKKIVEHVTHMLDMNELFIANHPVGVESRVKELIELLKSHHSEDPLLLGIWGMGGIGKTTIAKAVYNKICRQFDGRCFLLNIREVWDQDNGGLHLQQQLLSSVYKTTKIKIQNMESGKSILEKRLGQKRILVVLDDVDKLEQLNALAASYKWFCPGSIIIITTRDERLLSWLEIDKRYKMEGLNEEESIELFSWHAFKEPRPRKKFATLCGEVISYCGNLPLALEVIGSHLFERGIKEWKSVLNKLKSIPNKEVQKKLKISFDGLSDDKDREIFLDIAFFFIGMDKSDVTDILNGCGHSAGIGISILLERCLVTVDTKNKLRMHGLLRDMGREIIRESSPTTPEERSRLWYSEDVLDVLSKELGTKTTEGIALKLSRMNPICLKTKAFKYMRRLRLLQLAGVQLKGNFKHLSTDLRWLCWHGCPSRYTEANFDQRNLVAIDLKYSYLQHVWKKGQMMKKLKILNLSHSEHLTHTPDFSYLPNLKKLILKDCPRLCSISHTIGHLKRILLINLKDCTSLRVLPKSIYKLKSLKTLILSGCTKIDKLEEDLEQMKSLTTLMADNTAITKVPFALPRLNNIVYISLCGFEGLCRNVFPSIIWSWTSPTNNLSPQMHTNLDLSNLVSIMVSNSSSSHAGLSSIIKELPKVQNLQLECGSQLNISGNVNLVSSNVTNFKELEAPSRTSHVSNMNTSALGGCCSEGYISRSENSLNIILIRMGMNCLITKALIQRISQKLTSNLAGDFLLPGNNNPDWLTFSSEGSSVSFEVPKVNGRSLKAVILCIAYSSSSNIIPSEGISLKNMMIINYTKATTHVYEGDTLSSLKGEDWQSVLSNLDASDKVQVVAVVLGYGFTVKETTVYLIYDDPIDQTMKQQDEGIVSGNDMVADENVIVHGGDEKEEFKLLRKRKFQEYDDTSSEDDRVGDV
ncbi:disease resistance protein RPV1-like [Arachis stenosperma]|uniref:disease resistance protein RPV1-like n=1 Tax=Arachis stenosperma TaxID=217475 RepID=UPI0025AD4FB8|nr:disease resistance protein RPV1-like [Arachis stenosperma]